jgi:predicted O-linked N-acetylglucosamine transferase (SPINDLY family)
MPARRRGGTPGAAPGASAAAASSFAEGLAQHRAGRLTDAEAFYRRALEADPAHFDTRHHLGIIHYQRGEHIAAIRQIDAALEANPKVAAAHNNRGAALAALGRAEEAVESYTRAVALAPDYLDAHVNGGNALKDLGRLDAALGCYDKALALAPGHAFALIKRANVLQGLRRFAEAVDSYDRALALKSDASEAWNNRGVALAQLDRFAEAVASYDRALALKPDDAEILDNRGVTLAKLDRLDEAVASYDRAIALAPDCAATYNNRSVSLCRLGRFSEAIASSDRAIALQPANAEAFSNRGNALAELKRYEDALASYERAIALKPDHAEALYNRGNTLYALKRFDDALASYDRAIGLRLDHADAFNNRGNALRESKRFDEALASYERAIGRDPEHAEYHNNRAIALAALKRHGEALASYDRAIALKPDYADAWNNRGFALRDARQPDAAVASFAQALALEPDLAYLKGTHLHAKMHVCDWTQFNEACADIRTAIADMRRVALPFQLLATPASAEEQLQCARMFAGDKLGACPAPLWRGERYAHRRIRVAYLSSDLRDHPVAALTAGLFARHDRTRFETFAISFKSDASDLRARLRPLFDRFIDAERMSDAEVARLMRELEIDIAVDLNGSTEGMRPGVLVQRPAPVQVNYLGYAGTLGRSTWDYIVADRFVIPEDSRAYYAENVVYLSDCFMANDDGRGISPRVPSRAEAGLPERGFVFCCFNNSYKITPAIFDVWMRLLGAVEGSVLWLSAAHASAVANLRREAAQRGVVGDRLVFAPRLPRNEDHLARLRLADLFVDTLYFNAHTTAADALWAGVPVLTCPGATYASRVAGSLLAAVGLPELITRSLADYEALALRLARDPGHLAALRHRLAHNRDTFPLFDTRRFTRNIEAAYATMWERTQRGEPPQSFAVVDEGGKARASTARAVEAGPGGEPPADDGRQSAAGPALAASADPTPLLSQALACHQAGRLAQAEQLYRQVLETHPGQFDSLHLLGVVHSQQGNHAEAVRSIDLALVVRPDAAAAHNSRAAALNGLKRLDEALASCDRSIALDAHYAEAHNNRANILHQLERYDEALASARRALALKPELAEASYNCGLALHAFDRNEEALASYDEAIRLKPAYAECHHNRAIVLAELNRLDDALASHDRSIAIRPDYAEAWNNRGFVLRDLGRVDAAAASFGRALALRPHLPYLKGSALHANMQVCDWTDHDRDCAEVGAAVTAGAAAAFPLQILACSSDPAMQLACARRLVDEQYPASSSPLWRGEHYAHRRIRLAYVSADLRDHPVAALSAGMFARHNRARFETFAISLKSDASEMRARLKSAFDRFIDAERTSDADVAGLMRELEIDIAVDLMGFTEAARPGVFARRPAPVQVNYLGYAGTLGRRPTWDYIIADRFVIPEGDREHYAENVVYLPDCFMANNDGRKIAPRVPSRAEEGLPERGFVFCCFNNSYKITPGIFDVWMRLLGAVEGSVLWLSATNPIAVANLRREAERRGIAADRLVFAPRVPRNEDHLARLRLADLFVDTLHYNAHATAADALWAGVPVLTCPGATFSSRVAGSLLHAIGLPELIAGSLADYERLALALAFDRDRLAAIRERLAHNRGAAPLFDTDRFTRAIEAAYVAMWERAERGEPPQAFGPGECAQAVVHAPPRRAPEQADASSLVSRALSLHQAGGLSEAEELYRQALAIDPRQSGALHLLGLVRFQRGDCVEAVRQFDLAVAIRPDFPAAYNSRAAALIALKRFDEALADCDRALALRRDLAEALANRGLALVELERFEEALASCDEAIARRPSFPEALSNRGLALAKLERLDDALASYDRAIALTPDHVEALNNRADTLVQLRRFAEALDSAERTVALRPDLAQAHCNRAIALQELKRVDEACASYAQALALDPGHKFLKGAHLHARMAICNWTSFDAECAKLDRAVRAGAIAALPFHLLPCPSDPQTQLGCAKLFMQDRIKVAFAPLWRGERYSHERIRLAYLSSDFADHAVSQLAAGLFEHHDRSRFETIAISSGQHRPGAMRTRLEAAFERFVDAADLGDPEIARLLRDLEVDIAVDLNGITEGARPGVFARRPAPVQVAYLGYAGTMGSPHWDYILADRFVIPADDRHAYTEQVVELPDCFMVNDDRRQISDPVPSRAQVGLPEHGFVFCCFNNAYKITPDVFDIWMRLLRRIEGSVLWLSSVHAAAAANLRREAQARGVAADRLVFASRTARNEDHLARIRLADLFVDTLYYNAHVTAADALWAGVPVLTCPGATFASRVGGSLLQAVGLPELIVGSLADYEALAVRLAREPACLAELRQKLARNRATHPLFDTARFTRTIEGAYATMWDRAQRDEPSQGYAVPAVD